MRDSFSLSRRSFCAGTVAALAGAPALWANWKEEFSLKYMLASSMYGYWPVAEIAPEVHKTGSVALDIWPKVHGDQREQLDEMGEEKFQQLLREHQIELGCITQYKLGPFGLQDEMRLAERLGCATIVTGGRGPRDAKGSELKAAVKNFVEQMKPHLAVAEETGVTIAVENHANNMINTPDSLKWLHEFRPNKYLSIAFAPYHLPITAEEMGQLIRDLGPDSIALFYAWQHGDGSGGNMSKERELLQLPGRGPLDFVPLLAALKAIQFTGWTEIFMHPHPRGTPMLDTVEKMRTEINFSRDYLTSCLKKI